MIDILKRVLSKKKQKMPLEDRLLKINLVEGKEKDEGMERLKVTLRSFQRFIDNLESNKKNKLFTPPENYIPQMYMAVIMELLIKKGEVDLEIAKKVCKDKYGHFVDEYFTEAWGDVSKFPIFKSENEVEDLDPEHVRGELIRKK